MRRLAALAATFGLLASGVAACGGDDETGATTEQATAGAELLREDTFAYAALDSDLDSDQWAQLDELLQRFPGREDLIRELREEFEDDEVNYERDVEPAIGTAFYVGVTDLAADGEPQFVVLHQPEDEEKFDALLAKADADNRPEVRKLDDGWYALADDAAAFDAALRPDGGESLADNERFQDAMTVGADEALAKVYVDGASLVEALRELGDEAGISAETLGFERLESLAASFSAEDEGVRLDGEAQGELGGGSALQPFESKLVPQIPSDALAVVSFRGGSTTARIDELRSQPEVREGLEQFEQMLGVTLDDLLPLLRNEIAFYVRPGAPIPELTLVLETADEEAARATLDDIADKVVELTKGERTQDTVDGLETTRITIGGLFSVYYAAFDGRLMLTTARRAFADFRSDGDKLSEQDTFQETKEAVGMPDENAGFVYLNLRELIPLVLDFAELSDEDEIPEEVSENVRPLTALLAYGTAEDGTASFSAFLKID